MIKKLLTSSLCTLALVSAVSLDAQAQNFPSAPQRVRATKGRADSFVTVKWSRVAGATSYDVFRTLESQSILISDGYIGDRIASEVFGDTFLDDDAIPGVRYRYQIRPRKNKEIGQTSQVNAEEQSSAPNVGWITMPSSATPLAVKKIAVIDADSGEELRGQPISSVVGADGRITISFDIAKLSKQRLALKIKLTRPAQSIGIKDRFGNVEFDNSESFTLPVSNNTHENRSWFYTPLSLSFDRESSRRFWLPPSGAQIYTITPYSEQNGGGQAGTSTTVYVNAEVTR